MWCQHCGQDVPVVGLAAACPRCQHPVENARVAESSEAAVELSDDWHAERRLKHIGRSLRVPLATSRTTTSDQAMHWVDMAAVSQPQEQRHHPTPGAAAMREAVARRASERRVQIIAWVALVFGLGLAVGGVVLMGMGMFGEHPIFWQWGVGVTLAGQAFLIAGLVKILMTLWGSSRAATRRLIDMQQELAEVGRTAESIIAQRPGGPSGFYGELARGASPALLLANLKGQIDHLATRLRHDV